MSHLKKVENPIPMVGCYSLDVYCDTENPAHEHAEFPHQFYQETASASRALARRCGWAIHMDGTATCPKCNQRRAER
jgi:hypothetical protein